MTTLSLIQLLDEFGKDRYWQKGWSEELAVKIESAKTQQPVGLSNERRNYYYNIADDIEKIGFKDWAADIRGLANLMAESGGDNYGNGFKTGYAQGAASTVREYVAVNGCAYKDGNVYLGDIRQWGGEPLYRLVKTDVEDGGGK